ncbi:unnamed protein product [Mucor fragilis]
MSISGRGGAHNATCKDQDIIAAISIIKLVIKNTLMNIVKFWSPLIEKAFKDASIISYWGDTITSSLISIGVEIKMSLRLIAVIDEQSEDHGYGELAKQSSAPRHYKDKRK